MAKKTHITQQENMCRYDPRDIWILSMRKKARGYTQEKKWPKNNSLEVAPVLSRNRSATRRIFFVQYRVSLHTPRIKYVS